MSSTKTDLQAAFVSARLVAQQPHNAVNRTMRIVLSTALPFTLPALMVEPGLSVSLNALSTNAGTFRAGMSQEDLQDGCGRPIPPGKSGDMPCDHLGQIWVVGTVGDVLLITISGATVR